MAEDRETIVWSDTIERVFSPEGAVLVRWLKKDGDGYSLDPSLPVHYVTFDPAAESTPKRK